MNFTEPAEFLVSLIQHSDRVSIDVEMLDWLVVFGELVKVRNVYFEGTTLLRQLFVSLPTR